MTANASKSILRSIDIERCLNGLDSILSKTIEKSIVGSDRKLSLRLDVERGRLEIMEVSSNHFTLSLDDGTVASLNNSGKPSCDEVEQKTDRVKGALRRALKRASEQCDRYSVATLSLTIHNGTLRELDQRITSVYTEKSV